MIGVPSWRVLGSSPPPYEALVRQCLVRPLPFRLAEFGATTLQIGARLPENREAWALDENAPLLRLLAPFYTGSLALSEPRSPLPSACCQVVIFSASVFPSAPPAMLIAEGFRLLAPGGELWLETSSPSPWSPLGQSPRRWSGSRRLRDLLRALDRIPRRVLPFSPSSSSLLRTLAPFYPWLTEWRWVVVGKETAP